MKPLVDKIMPTLMVALIIAVGSAYVELKELCVKVTYIEKTIAAYHEK